MFDCRLVYTFWQLITDNVATSLYNSSFLQHFENAMKLMIFCFPWRYTDVPFVL